MTHIHAENLTKTFQVASRKDGLLGTLKHFFHRHYREVQAVKGVSFSIEKGEIVGFLGPNGAGKTTTLKMLSGLIHPSAGKLEVAGSEPFRRQRAFQKSMTLVMGNKQQLIWDLPALDSLRINAAVYEIPEAEYHRRVEELSGMLELGEQLRQPVRKLSLGERMKAELMAALLHRPEVLFLDEPTLGLDINAQVAMRNFLKAYNRRYGATVLLTSHYMADITSLCRRVLLIHQGSLIYDGSLETIMERFAPYREVRLELAGEPPPGTMERYGEVAQEQGRSVCLIIRREELTRRVEKILAELELVDLTISDPPVETIIGRIFSAGSAQ